MKEFYWVCLLHRREVYPLAYHATKEQAETHADRLNKRVAELGGNVRYAVRSDGGNARSFLDSCAFNGESK